MIDAPELGYTPDNLKAIRKKYGLTQNQVAGITRTTISTVQRWEASPNIKNSATMPHPKWMELLKFLGIEK